LAIVGNGAVTDSAVIPQKNLPNTFAAGSMQSFTSNVTLPPLRLLGGAYSDRTVGNFGFDTTSKRPTFSDGSNLFYGMSNPGTTVGDVLTCTTNATPCAEGVIAAGSTGLFLRSNGAGVAPSYAIPNFTQIGGLSAPSQISSGVNAQTGTSYTYADSDRATLVTHNNAAAMAATLPQANGSTFTSTWFVDIQNRGAGTLTITPATSTIDGNATLALSTGQGARIFSDGANYFTQRGLSSKTVTCQTGLGDGLNSIAAGTYLQSACFNEFGVTWTIAAIKCYTDNNGASTLNVTNGAGTGLLTGAITCTNTIPGASGTQSGTTTLASLDGAKFTFVSDGASKHTTWVITGTR
jgi:hypothetical protein